MTRHQLRLLFVVLMRLSKFLIVLALAGTIGLHWTLLQSVAWVGMMASYSQDSTFSEALTKTFDGKHPCALCLKIAKNKQAEKKSDLQLDGKKLEFVSQPMGFVFNAPQDFSLQPSSHFPTPERLAVPPTPPPKAA